MALNYSALKLLKGYLKGSVLSLGYPDLVVPDTKFLGVEATEFVDTGRWHGVNYQLPETNHVFGLMGCDLHCVDIHASRGCEEIADLNYPQELGKYDLVIDAGTLEHCFNISQAMFNMANAVKVGGHIFHSPPMTMVNHGFYNLCPTFFHDFYTQNDFTIEHLSGWTKDKHGEVPPVKRFTSLPEASLFVIARKNNEAKLVFPVQTKYLLNPELK